MDTSRMNSLLDKGWTLIVALGIRVIEALAIWIIGRWLIGLALRIIGRGMTRQKIDPTVIRYIQNAVGALLNIVLVIAILNFFGVETTSLAALIAAGGVAIGLAWSGLLANFAAGVFMVILQPFKVGDFVVAGGVMGTVERNRTVRDLDQHARQHSQHRRKRQDLRRHHPELHPQSVPKG
jgi:small conductance mechanosensitive channel